MEPDKLDARELAGRTADEIQRRGWHQGGLAAYPIGPERYCDLDQGQDVAHDWFTAVDVRVEPDILKDCKVCLIGGIAAAAYGDPRMQTAVAEDHADLIGEILQLTYFDRAEVHYDDIDTVIEWNDAGARTEAEVIDVLRKIQNGPGETDA